MLARTRFAVPVQIIIALDDELAGDQGEGLYVHKVKFKRNNTLHEGVEFSTRISDLRDAHLYDFTYKEGTNEGCFYKPAMEAPYRLDKADLDARILAVIVPPPAAGVPNPEQYIVDGRDAARVAFEKKVTNKPEAVKKKYEVFLPEGFKLSQRAFGEPLGKEGVFTKAARSNLIYRRGFGTTIVDPNNAGQRIEPDTYHVFVTWRFVNASRDTELAIAGNTIEAALGAAVAGL